MKTVLYTLLIGFGIALGGVGWVLWNGFVPISAVPSEHPALQWLLHSSYEQAVRRAATQVKKPEPWPFAEQGASAAADFHAMCASCHTPPGEALSVQVQGMNPQPPRFSELMQRRSPTEAFWVIKHGVRMTGMPAFGPTHSDEQLWPLVAFLQQGSEMSAEEYAQKLHQAGAKQGSADDGHDHSHGPAHAAPTQADPPEKATPAESSHQPHDHRDHRDHKH